MPKIMINLEATHVAYFQHVKSDNPTMCAEDLRGLTDAMIARLSGLDQEEVSE